LETPRPVHPASLPPGSIVGSWRLLGLVSRNIHGVVFRAERTAQPESGSFALKLALQPGDPRFAVEVELLSRIRHPNVPRVHDSGQWSGPGGALFPFLVIDWIKGLPLYSWARVQPRTSREELRVLAQAASALEAVHAAGAIHRDIKGDSLIVRPEDGHAMLADFSSCVFYSAPLINRGPEVPGTPQYHSPQSQLHQWKYRRIASARYDATAADDLYALGVTAYRLATGRYPLIAEEMSTETDLDEFFSRFPDLVPADELVELSPALARWIRQMLAVEPKERGTAAELAVGLALAADKEGPEGDQLIRSLRAPVPTEAEEDELSSSSRPALQWHTKLKGSAGFFLLVVAGGAGLPHALPEQSSSADASQHRPAAQAPAPESDTSVLREFTLPETMSPVESVPEQQHVSAAVPAQPFFGQRLPLCKGPQVEINGGCWYLVGNEMPPCSEITYEWKKRCYWPAIEPSRPANTREK
jgi:eukaryotic-like serine/threonine-protein kinase